MLIIAPIVCEWCLLHAQKQLCKTVCVQQVKTTFDLNINNKILDDKVHC